MPIIPDLSSSRPRNASCTAAPSRLSGNCLDMMSTTTDCLQFLHTVTLSVDFVSISIDTMTPYNPKTSAKIRINTIATYRRGCCVLALTRNDCPRVSIKEV